MRTFKIWNKTETESVELSHTGILTTEVSGLGTKFAIKKNYNRIYDTELEFEPISLQLIFGINSNAYEEYQDFLDFIIENGKNNFVLEYKSYDANIRYCEVWIENAPKTQKTEYNVIQEQFTFHRQTPWYEKIIITKTDASIVTITNSHFLPTYAHFTCYGNPISITFERKTTLDAVVQKVEIDFSDYVGAGAGTLVLDGENKKALFALDDDEPFSVYDLIDKTGTSFIEIPQGTWKITIPVFDSLVGKNTVLKYKKWVSD
ncbi:MAG: phage baseplate protein [Methanolobus sp.]|nr:phage baseplate protein [Methanolobus sp.]